MSWHFVIDSTESTKFSAAADKAEVLGADTLPAEEVKQSKAVKEALKAIVASGVMGGKGRVISATAAGHGNKGHVSELPGANDSIQITILQNFEGE